jgi:hypothetical protein
MDEKLKECDRLAKRHAIYDNPRTKEIRESERRPPGPGAELGVRIADEKGEMAHRHGQEFAQLLHRHALEDTKWKRVENVAKPANFDQRQKRERDDMRDRHQRERDQQAEQHAKQRDVLRTAAAK